MIGISSDLFSFFFQVILSSIKFFWGWCVDIPMYVRWSRKKLYTAKMYVGISFNGQLALPSLYLGLMLHWPLTSCVLYQKSNNTVDPSQRVYSCGLMRIVQGRFGQCPVPMPIIPESYIPMAQTSSGFEFETVCTSKFV